ncbi:TPA: endonuclease [Escherichia coli]|nr:endonuclease [Escherichia coli]
MEHFDVAIIGLGPAGSALARKLAGKMQVIALDKKHQCGTEGFSKPCGGLLAPDAQRSFIRDGLTLPVDVIANPQIFSVKTSTSPHRSRVTTSEAISILIAMLSTCG